MLVKQVRGFLLLEACIGILLIGIFSCLLTGWYMQLVRAERDLAQRIKAVMLARSLVEEYKALGSIPRAEKKDGFSVSWQILPNKKIGNFERVTVTIGRVLDGKLKSFSLTTGILRDAKRIKPH